MTAAQELAVVPPKETALQVFQQPNGLDPWLKQIRAEIDAFVPDVSTRKGREAIASIAHRVAALRDALAARQKYEAEQAELEELRRKQAEQEQRDREAAIAREAEERARREAEQRAQQEREAAARRELELKLQAEQAEREKLEAQQRAEQAAKDAEARAQAAAEAERQRIAAEQAEAERQRAAREADLAHKTAVLTGIKEAFMRAGINEDQAKAIVNMIRKGEVPCVSIQY